ncbi:glycosyl hydrolase family 61-domain-containing protein [Boeremia exigua]|uniref:glycosyl hydrolase family 61-domain-containing protein n=1 Tax=Boeremia exigua TaxID=749465 RepID=UPI001E8D6417|nr:glycosyl hydrolase family 61-domain-containing protein [Boeremia exigua]KAH6616904.1 glycosyl hydrolase family 61-domain-containing protein [Boeremia exigua]
MKISALALAAVAQVASAHYFFDTNIVGGTTQPAFKYVRQSSRAVKYNPIKFSSNPAADIRDGSTVDGPDIVCNQGAFASAGKTEVLTVNAGEEVRLKLAVGAKFQHPGPGLVYMSKAPASVKAYDGSGDWFKIYEEGVCDGGDFTSTAWCDYNRDWIAAKIPKDTPNGEYLVRMEHIGVHRSHVNQPEHYVSCLQVKVQGGGSGTPGPMVKFPGAYKATDPYANFSIYNGRKAFPMPGPAVWDGGASGSGSSSPTTPAKEVASSTPAAQKPTTMATVVAPKHTGPAGTGCATLFGQCGGQGYNGAKCCSTGSCKAANQWYSQCLN